MQWLRCKKVKAGGSKVCNRSMNTRHPRVCRCLQPQVWELADLNSRVLAEWVWDEPQHPMCWNNWGSHGPVPEHPRPGMGHVADPVVPCTMLRIAKAKGSNRVCSACRALDPQWSQTIGSTTAKPCKICDTLGHCAAWCCNWFLSILDFRASSNYLTPCMLNACQNKLALLPLASCH